MKLIEYFMGPKPPPDDNTVRNFIILIAIAEVIKNINKRF